MSNQEPSRRFKTAAIVASAVVFVVTAAGGAISAQFEDAEVRPLTECGEAQVRRAVFDMDPNNGTGFDSPREAIADVLEPFIAAQVVDATALFQRTQADDQSQVYELRDDTGATVTVVVVDELYGGYRTTYFEACTTTSAVIDDLLEG